jgi:hypothetical protein
MTDGVNEDVKRATAAADAAALEAELPAGTVDRVLLKVRLKRREDDERKGFFRDFPDGTAGRRHEGPKPLDDAQTQADAREALTRAMRAASPSWRHHLELAVANLMVEDDEAKLEERLVEVAAVAVAWAEGIEMRVDRRRIDAEAAKSRKLRVVALDGGGEMVLREYSVPTVRVAWWKRFLAWLSPK